MRGRRVEEKQQRMGRAAEKGGRDEVWAEGEGCEY
jgi:hypothetical protein